MGKYQKYGRKPYSRPYQTHPVWRGIGCVLMVVVPVISFAVAHELANGSMRGMIPIPYDLMGYIKFPDWIWKIPYISIVAGAIARYPNPWAVIAFGFVIIVILTAIFSTAYAFLYRFIGPSRYTHLDAPPPKKPRGMRKSR
jgi:hypothetical protein